MGRHIGKRNRLNTRRIVTIAAVAVPTIVLLAWLLRPQEAVQISLTQLSPVNNVLDDKGELHVAWSTDVETTAIVALTRVGSNDRPRRLSLPLQKDHKVSFSAEPGQVWDVDITAHTKWAHPTHLTRLRFAPQSPSSQPAQDTTSAPAAK